MNTSEYLDALRTKLDIPSDYALSKRLGVSRQAVSNFRNGSRHFDDDVANRVADLLGIHRGLVILDMHRQRAKTPQERSMWQEIFQGFRLLFPHAKGATIA